MNQLILLALFIFLNTIFSSESNAQDINTGQTIRGEVTSKNQILDGSSWVDMKGNGNGNAFVLDNSSKNPFSLTTRYSGKIAGPKTNFSILSVAAGLTLYVSQVSIFSDGVGAGEFKFCFNSDGTGEFFGGYFGATPSGAGDMMYCSSANQNIYFTCPSGTYKIFIQYSTVAP